MVNANELRIGNWILIRKKKDGYPYELASGHDIEELEGCPEAADPIPLSPEILLKCGFETVNALERDDAEWRELLSENGVLFCEGNKNGYCDVYLDMEDTIRVRYLHQLQNLYFSLTGKELEYIP